MSNDQPGAASPTSKGNEETPKVSKGNPKKQMSTMQKVRLVVTGILGVLLIIFIVQNSNRVEVEFLNFTKRVPIVIIMLISLLIGSLITYLLMKYRAAKKKRNA